MSVPVELTDLANRIAEFGDIAFLVTVGDDASSHAVSVRVGWRDDRLVVGAGRSTARNATAHPHVALLWPPAGGDYALITDGRAELHGDELEIAPTKAVLHRMPGADQSAPSCVTVLPKS